MKIKKCNGLFSKHNKAIFCGEMVTNGRKRHFHSDEKASSGQIYALLDDVESADKNEIDNLMNDSDTEIIAEEEITVVASTQYFSSTIPEANLQVVPSDKKLKKKEKNKKEESWKWTKKARRVSPRTRNTSQSK